MQSKNAIGNLINRYKAVLKKCHLLNTFGTLVMASALALGAVSFTHAAAFVPTLDDAAVKQSLVTSGAITQGQADAMFSGYTVTPNVTPNDPAYYTTFTTKENGVDVTYGVLLKGYDYDNAPDTNKLFSSVADLLTYNKNESGYASSRLEITTDDTSHTQNFYGISSSSLGGAIYNAANNVSITGDFIGNSATHAVGSRSGGALYNTGSITTLMGNFIGNSAASPGGVYGGAIYNEGDITTIIGDFIGNSAASSGVAYGGAIGNSGNITTIIGDFIGNSATGAHAHGGAIYSADGDIKTIIGNFIGNSTSGNGGAIYNNDKITSITNSTFTGNWADAGGAIFNTYYGTITSITNSTFTGNWADTGGAISNEDEITDIKNSTFTSNWADGAGGAIYTTQSLNFTADTANPSISGNYVNSDGGASKDYNAIYLDAADLSLTFNVNNGGSYTLDDNVRAGIDAASGAQYTYTFSVKGDGTGEFNLNNTLYNASAVTVNNATLNLGAGSYGSGSIEDADLHIISNGEVKFNADVAFAGAVNIGDDSTSGTLTLAADKDITIENGGSLTLHDGTLALSGTGALTIQSGGAANFYTDISLSNIFTNSGTTTFKGITTLGTVTNNDTIIADGATFTNKYTVGGATTALNNVTFNEGYESAGTLNIGNVSTAGAVTLAANKNMTIQSGGTLNVNDGSLTLSGTGALTIQNGGKANFHKDISLGSNFTNNGTTTFMGTTTLGNVTNNGAIIADGATFTNKYTVGGATTALNNVTFNEGYESAGTLNIGNASTAGAVTLAANKNMTIQSGGTLNVNDGSLTLSGTGALTIQSEGTANFYTDISLSNIFTNSGTTTFKGTTALGSVTNNNTIIADGATFTNKYTAGGTTTALNNVAFNGGYESAGILNIGNDSTAGTLTLAAGKSMDIASGGSFNLLNGSADLSDGTLKVAANAASFSTASDTTLTVKGDDFGSFTGLGEFTQNTDIAKKLENDGHLVLEGVDLGTIDNATYDMLLANMRSTAISGGTVQFGTTTTVDMYSLSNVQDGYGQNAAIMAGNLASPKEVLVSHIIANNTDPLNLITASNIADGAELTITGATNTTLLDEGSLENSGTLNLGVSGASHTSNFNGTLTTTSTGETTVLSETTFNKAVSNEGTFTAEATSTFKDDFTSSGTSAFNNEATFTQDLNISGASTTFYGAAIVGDDIDITGGVTTFHDSLSVKNVVEVGAGTLEVHAGMTMLGETVNSESAKFDIQSGGTFNLVGGNVDLSDVTFSTADSSTLESAFGTELTVGIATIGVNDQGVSSGTAATVDAATNVDALLGTVNITGFADGLNLTIYDVASSGLSADYAALNQAATDAYGTDANIIFDGVTFDTTGLTLTFVADNNLSGLGESSVDSGSVGSGKVATVGSIRDADASGVSATNNGGTLTITGQSTEIGQENKISAGDVVTSNSGITNLGNDSAISTVGGSVVSDNTTTTNSTTTLFNVNVQENLENTGSGKTVVRGNTSVQGATTLNANAELKAQDATFTAVGDTTLSGGTLLTTSIASGSNFANASATFLSNLTNGIDGHIIAGLNAYTVLGAGNRDYAETIFGNSGHDWGTGVTAALFIAKPQTLASAGSIHIDGSGTNITAAGNNEAKFAANSLLVVDATGVGASAALASTGGTLTVASGSKLVISGGDAGTVTVASGFTNGSTIAANAWGFDGATLDNVSTVNETLKIDSVLWEGGKFTVNLVQNAFVLDGVDASVSDFMDAARDAKVNGAFFDFMDNKNNPDAQRVKASEVVPQAAAMAGVARGTMNATSAAAGAIGLRNNVGGIGTHKPAAVVVKNNKFTKEQSLNGGSDMQSSKNGVGLWLMPLYKWSNVSGIESGVLDGGYETGLGGLTLGADYTFENNFRLGVAFNLGAGYTESSGDFSGTDNDFDFYGVSLYAGYSYENLNISADVGYTASTHDVTQKMGVASYKADIFADAWTVGLGASYTFKTDFMDITPHVGVRYMGVNTYGYDIADLEMDSDFQGVWYFPVGVTLSKDIVTDSGWTFTPKLDLGFIAAAGDLEVNSTAGMAGVNAFIQKETTNVDGFAFNGGLGFELANEESGVSLGLNYNLQASEHETAHMINATFRFDF